MTTKQKDKAEQNGRVQAAQEITPEAAQQVINEAERLKDERYMIEYQRLCAEYGREIAGQPIIKNGLTIAELFVRRIPNN